MSPHSADGDPGLHWGWGRGFCPRLLGSWCGAGLGQGRGLGPWACLTCRQAPLVVSLLTRGLSLGSQSTSTNVGLRWVLLPSGSGGCQCHIPGISAFGTEDPSSPVTAPRLPPRDSPCGLHVPACVRLKPEMGDGAVSALLSILGEPWEG